MATNKKLAVPAAVGATVSATTQRDLVERVLYGNEGQLMALIVGELCTLHDCSALAACSRGLFKTVPLAVLQLAVLQATAAGGVDCAAQWAVRALLARVHLSVVGDAHAIRDRYRRAQEAERRWGVPAQNVGRLAAVLQNRDQQLRLAAMEALGDIGEQAAPAVEAIAGQLEDRDLNMRWAALGALKRLRGHATPVVGTVAGRLEDCDSDMRRLAVVVLQGLGCPIAAPFAGAIARLLKDRHRDVRVAAICALGKCGAHAAPFAKAIAERLHEEREAAMGALKDLGEHAAPAADMIAARLEHGDRAVRRRRAAVWALHGLGECAPLFMGAISVVQLEDTSEKVRRAAVLALQGLGERVAPLAVSIARRLDDRSVCVREAAMEALQNLGVHAAPAAVAIAGRLEDSDRRLRRAAMGALQNLAEHAAPFAAAITMRLEDSDENMRRAAAKALQTLRAASAAEPIAVRIDGAHVSLCCVHPTLHPYLPPLPVQ